MFRSRNYDHCDCIRCCRLFRVSAPSFEDNISIYFVMTFASVLISIINIWHFDRFYWRFCFHEASRNSHRWRRRRSCWRQSRLHCIIDSTRETKTLETVRFGSSRFFWLKNSTPFAIKLIHIIASPLFVFVCVRTTLTKSTRLCKKMVVELSFCQSVIELAEPELCIQL